MEIFQIRSSLRSYTYDSPREDTDTNATRPFIFPRRDARRRLEKFMELAAENIEIETFSF